MFPRWVRNLIQDDTTGEDWREQQTMRGDDDEKDGNDDENEEKYGNDGDSDEDEDDDNVE